jgi:hypothetical protein
MAAAWHKKSKEWDMGSYSPTDEEYEARLWCIRNKIYISPFAKGPAEWYIDITLNGKINRSPHVYIKDMIWENIYKFYKYYYDKHKK